MVLLSDPTMPDRSESFLAGTEHVLLERLTERVDQLACFGTTKIIICCVTIHPLIERLAPALQEKIISLVDVAMEHVLLSNRKYLLVCTEGTRHTRIFQNHRLWEQTRDRIVLPDQEDQHRIHELIYKIKTSKDAVRQIEPLDALLEKYAVDSYIVGCTEIHMLAKERQRFSGPRQAPLCIDPLAEIATMICNFREMASEQRELIG